MSGVKRECNEITYGQAFPNSQYHDPRGGRPSGLESNVLRYRAFEAALFLFYTEDVKRFMLSNIFPLVPPEEVSVPATSHEKKVLGLILAVSKAALSDSRISYPEFNSIESMVTVMPNDSKRLRQAFAHAVEIGLCTLEQTEELQDLINYRNDIAHRIQNITADVSRHTIAIDFAALVKKGYQSESLNRIRLLRRNLIHRSNCLDSYVISMNSMIFEFAEKFYESEIARLSKILRIQVKADTKRVDYINKKIEAARQSFKGDLDPRHPQNFQRSRNKADSYPSFSGRLSKRGSEICHRLFEAGYENIVVAYLVGISVRSVERRRNKWLGNS